MRRYKNKKNHHSNTEKLISQGKCPDCGKNLVYRQSYYGGFVGCMGFPHCRFTVSERSSKTATNTMAYLEQVARQRKPNERKIASVNLDDNE